MEQAMNQKESKTKRLDLVAALQGYYRGEEWEVLATLLKQDWNFVALTEETAEQAAERFLDDLQG